MARRIGELSILETASQQAPRQGEGSATSSKAGSGIADHVPQWLTVLVFFFIVVAASASVRNSTTFDEIIFPAAGARGYATGDFNMIKDHPPVMQYVYGLPLRAMDLNYPPEDRQWGRYPYAQSLLWGSGNAPDKIIFAARMMGILLGAGLIMCVFGLTERALSPPGALLAATLVAFLPDVLAHASVSYNDVPIAFALFAAVFAIDRAVREPSPSRIALAAGLAALAAGVKTTGLVAFPVLFVMLAMEAFGGRWSDRAWRRRVLIGIPLFAVVFYVVMVGIYLGDFSLEAFRRCLAENTVLNTAHRPALLLGQSSREGFWYFFPVAFLLKTPAALHVLLLLAVVAAVIAWRHRRRQEWLLHPLRAAPVAALVILAVLMTSRINIGFRHAMPALPFVCVLIAAGVMWLWERGALATRLGIGALLAANIVSVLGFYPYFLPYVSEYVRHRPMYETLVDSNTDWGEGLVALRDYMRTNGIERVYLGYFGSALPEGYDIDYVSMPSFFALPERNADQRQPPKHIAVSATALAGIYGKGDPYAALRSRRPLAIVARSIYIYDIH